MSKFLPGQSGNPNGRKPGSKKIKAAQIAGQVGTVLAPYCFELVERAVEEALLGDAAALSAVLNIYAAALNVSAVELQASLDRQKRQP